MGLIKVFLLVIIAMLLQGKILKDQKSVKMNGATPLSNSIWHRFECRANSDCPKTKYCLRWACVLRPRGFCMDDSGCSGREWCNIQHQCVQKSWCDGNNECNVDKCCAKIDPFAQGRCLAMAKPGELCLIETVLCPCVKGYYCKAFSKRRGRCTKNED